MGIRIITEPSVFILGRQAVDRAEMSRYLSHVGAPDFTTDATSAAEELTEVSSRGCYDSYRNPRPGGNAAHIAHILDVGHGSVTEHAVWTVAITGISRSLTHELVRHRVGISPSQLSQRFVDESDCAFVVPPALIGGDDTKDPDLHFAYHAWRLGCEYARDCYMECAGRLAQRDAALAEDKTLRRKRAREAARSVLPNCVETKLVITANCRALRHLMELRGSRHADAEFRRLAVALARRFKAEAANLFSDVEVIEVDGVECVGVSHHKV